VSFAAKARAVANGYLSFRKAKRAMPVLKPAADIARSHMSDQDALREVASLVAGNREAAELAHQVTERSIDPANDRAYRLISAALEGGPVRPVDPAKAPMVSEFRRWTELPLGEAFRQLSEREPEVAPIGAQAAAWGETNATADFDQRTRIERRLMRDAARLFPDWRESDELVIRSGLARTIALEYIEVALGDHARGDLATPLGEIMVTPYRVTISFGRPPSAS
jgi:hypothetical protein